MYTRTSDGLLALSVQKQKLLIFLPILLLAGLVLLPAPVMADDGDGPQIEVFEVTRHEDYTRAKSKRFKLYVSTRIVEMKTDEKPTGYIPLIFGLWNSKGKPFYVDRERIRLYDRYGNEIPMATLEELRQDYPHLRRDQQHRDFTTLGGRFTKGDRKLVPTNFFPPPGEALVDTAQVHRHRRVKDLLYFKGTMEKGEPYRLEITLRKSGDILIIPFRIKSPK